MNTDYCVACLKAQGESTGGQKDCRQCVWYEKPAPDACTECIHRTEGPCLLRDKCTKKPAPSERGDEGRKEKS